MNLTFQSLNLTKRHPLTISRGTSGQTENLLIEITHDGVTGIGEFAPLPLNNEYAEGAKLQLGGLVAAFEPLSPANRQRVEAIFIEQEIGQAVRFAIDSALYDWQGKKYGVPVYELLGLDPSRIVPTSITLGINPPDLVGERAALYLSEGAHALKIKLGSPDGIEHDKASYEAAREVALKHPFPVPLRIDANGGWRSVGEAVAMITWLSDRGCEYVEQPLARGREDELLEVFKRRTLPIYADESCWTAPEVIGVRDRVDGINLKLMKAGGITPGLRVIETARACGLKVMMGCMSEASLAIAASVALSPLADHLDLDSHLNLAPDPFEGLVFDDKGRVLPSIQAGLGVRLK
jgi:L-Ala-D/L-Glu epimerase